LYVPDAKPDTVVLLPVPVIAPGFNVQLPDGKSLNTTEPVPRAHVGCVIVPTVGAVGVEGEALITTFPLANDTQPEALVTVKLYVPATKPDTVVLLPVPVIAPGFNVQLPDGNPLSTTELVEVEQVGCVITPTVGAVGVEG